MTSTPARPLPIVVLISGSGSNLQAIIDAISAGLPAKICRVISNNPQAYGLSRAGEAGIPTDIVDQHDYADRENFDQALMNCIEQDQPALLVLAGFMRILTHDFVRHYSGHMINIHPSLLPHYQGLNTHQRVLDAGDAIHGVSVHFVSPELDSGPVILQAEIPVQTDDSAESLANRIHVQEHIIYPLVIRWFAEGRLHLHENSVILDGKPIKSLKYNPQIHS